jgi:oxygen-independent coproporphyrinogen-3 oxidase
MVFDPVLPEDNTPVGLYIHVPFCKARCFYCGFVSSIHDFNREAQYLRSVAREIELRAQETISKEGHALTCDTIYFGGGTPTLLSSEKIRALVATCRRWFQISDAPEITLEMNPGTVDLSTLSDFRRAGVNRASLGIQSLLDTELSAMGRLHDSAQALSAFRDLRRAGFDNISVDLIAGFPMQTLASVRQSLRMLLDLRPEHLSVYLLEVKGGTMLAKMIENQQLPAPDDDLLADMYEEICAIAVEAGYEHYEISNFALPGRFSRHNMKYWSDQVYLGFGPGAHGMTGRQRYSNFEDLDSYSQTLSYRSLPVLTVEEMSPEVRLKDAIIMGLRLVKGVDLDFMSARYGVDVKAFVLETTGDLISAGLLELRENNAKLTSKGRLLSNMVFSRWV